ncbi:hypothetical protein Ddc_11843 [Ditylenchus destructor]|nr:hypothetical protein Ddc_11843 [Ditylenchus destructor]
MLDFLRPIQDPNLRIMIPDKHYGGAGTSNGSQISSANDESEEGENEPILESPRARRHYKAYTVMQRSGFQHTEYVQIITNLCKAEILISFMFLIHGLSCPGFPDESSYQGTCHINVLSALVGLFTGGMGLGAVNRFRWKTVLVMWLIMCIISSVANLLAVITTGVWLDHLSKLKTRTGMANGLSGMMLLGSVLVGVCFILTAVLICHYWASNSAKYQAVGRIAKRARSLRRRTSRASSGMSGAERGSSRYHHQTLPTVPSTSTMESAMASSQPYYEIV